MPRIAINGLRHKIQYLTFIFEIEIRVATFACFSFYKKYGLHQLILQILVCPKLEIACLSQIWQLFRIFYIFDQLI